MRRYILESQEFEGAQAVADLVDVVGQGLEKLGGGLRQETLKLGGGLSLGRRLQHEADPFGALYGLQQ